jgi:hypothetical protein
VDQELLARNEYLAKRVRAQSAMSAGRMTTKPLQP